MPFTHYAFSDDSKHVYGRYNSLAIVSVEKDNSIELTDALKSIYSDSDVTEFKWKKVRDARYRFLAEKIIGFTFDNSDKIRVDVVIWDLEDSRHKNLYQRDNSENLVRMYYHLTSCTLSKRWPIAGLCWKWHPDHQSCVCWDTLRDCLIIKKHKCVSDLFCQNPEYQQVDLREIEPSDSSEHHFIQIADLFAGIGAYSCGHFEKYKAWKVKSNGQLSMFNEETDFSRGENEKLFIIDSLNTAIKDNKLNISLEGSKGFKTHDPKCFINFWRYTPQHHDDKAPIK